MDSINLDQYPQIPDFAQKDLEKKMKGLVTLEDGVSRAVMSGHDSGVAYRFFVHAEYNPTKSEARGYEVFDEIDCIQWLVDRRTKPVEMVKFLPAALLSFDRQGNAKGGRYIEAYKRFKAGVEVEGLQLRKWGVLTEAECNSLESESIYTVEQFAAMPDDRVIGRLPEEFVEAWKRAKNYIGGQDMARHYEENKEALEAERQRNLELAQRVAALEAQQTEVDVVRRVLDETEEESGQEGAVE